VRADFKDGSTAASKERRVTTDCQELCTSLRSAHKSHSNGIVNTQSTHRVAMATFRRTFHHDGKISLAWWGWGVHAHPLSQYLPSRTKLWCNLQLRGQTHSPYFYSTPISTLWIYTSISFLIRRRHWPCTGVVDICEQLISGINDTGEQFIAIVIDTEMSYKLWNMIIRGPGGIDPWKNTCVENLVTLSF
jgi:hypothetical protein